MKKYELESLIREIVNSLLTELNSLSTTDMKDLIASDSTLDPTVAPEDAQSPAEKARLEREKEHERRKTIQQKETELSSKKKEIEFNKKKLDQQKRFDIPNLTKDLQQLKGAKI